MLTNNKNFVRSIAMLLAMLMVMALCLTGCGNKAADEALTKAEEAKTAADAVAEALDGYVSKEDKATVKALVIEALGDDYATAAEIDALAEKLAAYVTADDVSKMIKDEMAKYALDKLSGNLITEEKVLEILKNYYTKDEVDAKLKNIFGEFTAEQVQAILKDAMSLKEWDKTSDVVLTTIEYLQVLLKALNEETYTQANMKKVNECLAPFGIVAFKDGADSDTRLDELKGNSEAIAEIAKLLEYTILRQATLEDMAELKAAVDAAVAVPTFEKSFKALKNNLYGLGDLYVVGDYDGNNGAFKADKYSEYGLTYYHETAVKGTDSAKVQIVTLADKAGFHAFANAHDALLAEYYADNTSASGSDGWEDGLNVYALYEVSTTIGGVTTKTLETKAVTATAPANATKLGLTMLSMSVADEAAYLKKVYQNEAAENEVLLFPLYDVDVNDLNQFVVTTDYEDSHTFPLVIDDLGCYQTGAGTWTTAYTLVWAQLNLVQAWADLANDVFQGGVKTVLDNNPFVEASDLEDDSFQDVSFLKDTIYADTDEFLSKKYENITDAEFLAALTAAMCEPVVEGVYDYPVYLINDVEPIVEAFKMMNGQAYDPTVGGFDKWDLYEKMMDKTFDLLWDKYKKQAANWANVILKDYISVAYEAVANTVGDVNTIGVNYTDKADLVDAMNNALAAGGLTTAEKITEDELTDGFLAAFLKGEEIAGSDIYDALKLTKKFKNSNLLAFYVNNGSAKVSTTKVDDLTATAGLVYANPLASIAQNAENIRQRLTGSMIYTELQIARADKDTYKATGVSVREAFYGLLKEGVENLDEIYARFLLEDYKKMTYNEMAVKAEKIVTFYNKGVADAAQTAAIERYLTGVATAASSEADILIGINAPKNATSKKITSVTYKANDLEDTLTNGFLTTNVGAVTVNVFAESSGQGTEKVAAAAMTKIDEFAAEATKTIENVLVKALFLNYLWEARGNLAAANITYDTYLEATIPTAWAVSIQLMEANNTADNQITVVEFFHNRGDYKLADYKTAYVDEVLKLVADKDNMHVALLSGKSIDEIVALDDAGLAKLVADTFKAQLAAVKSSADKNWVAPGKYSPYTTAADYYYIGEYAVDLDKILNTMEGRVTYYKDNSGNHKLY